MSGRVVLVQDVRRRRDLDALRARQELLQPVLAPGTDRLVNHHLVTEGSALVRLGGV